MKLAYTVIALLLAAFVMLYVAGGVLMQSCSEIGGCKTCWQNRETEVQSELCSNLKNCTASPEKQEYNARIDTILCACSKAAGSSYADKDMNSQIEKEAEAVLGYSVKSNELCDQPGNMLVKRKY